MLKNNKRRFITIILLTLTLLSALFIPTEKARAASSFTDINHHWAYDTILRWENLGVLQDFAIGRFTPDAPITRAEFFALLVRTLGATEQADISQFSDVWQESWYYHIVAIAFNMGIAIGYDDGLMRPDDNLLRQDAITLMARALGMSSANTWILSSYSDYYSISPYASTYLAWFIEKDLLNGYPDGTLRPRNNITRAEAIKLIDNIFPHIHQLESTFYNVYLQGDLLVPKGDAELRDLVLYGDVIIGDGVGQGNVLISNCNINGRLVIRGGGSNSVTLSNSSVNTIYVASFAADTHIAITDNSLVPLIEAVSGFTLSGSGVTALTLLDQARESCLINLNGVNLDEFNIGGRNAKINFISGRSVNINFEGAGQNSILNMANGTSAENINIAAPNVSITGTGLIRSLLVLNSGASVEQKPDFTTVGVNMSAIINGQLIAGPAAAAPNLVNRAKDDSLQVLLLHNNRRLEPFNQDTLNISTTEGRSATEIMVVQDVSGRVSLTEHNGRLAYWIGFFIPEPRQSDNISALTYEYADGSPVTVYKELERYNGQRGLIIYLPVFRKSATETGQLKETLYINWGYGITENLQFMSSTLFLTPLTYDETNILQNEFNKGIFHSIDEERPPYSGAEAIRRILNSDNPLGLPSSNNKGLDALNRSVTPADIRSVLEENQFSQDLTIDTSGNSAYSRLSEDGKNAVAEAVLNGRKTPYATAASVKAIFDKAVSERLTKESTLLSLINGAGDAGALRKIIENSANAAILHFQTGADPYKSYPTVQKDEMAAYLFSLRPYPSLQSVIDAIKDYLNTNEPKEPDTKDAVISGVSASPRTITMASGNKREVKLTVNTSEGKLTPADIGKITTWNWNTTGANSPLADVTLQDDVITLLANNPGRDTLTVSVGGKTTTISVTVSPPKFATALKLNKTSLKLVVDGFERLTYTLTPTDATDNLKWNSDNEAVCIVNGGVVTAVGRGRSIITLESTDNPSLNATCEVWVFHDENDIIITPDIVTLGEGSKYQVRYELYKPIQAGGNVELQWKPANPNIATVTSTGLITAVGLDPNQASEPNKTAITAEVWVAGKPPGTESGTAHITVVVENRRSLEIGITNAIMFQGERQSLEITRLLDPITKQPILPYAPGQQFIWEINEGGKVQFVVNNQVSGSSITLNTTTLPGIQATGIGRSFISVKTSPSEQPIHTIEVVSVPKGVQNMHFFNNGKEITNAEGYGRVLEILNNENAQVTATEKDDTGRLMTWTTLEVDQYRNTRKPAEGTAAWYKPGTTPLSPWYSTDGSAKVNNAAEYLIYKDMLATNDTSLIEINSTLIRAPGGLVTPLNNKTGLAAVRVTPVRDPNTEKETTPGAGTFLWVNYWYARVSLFITDTSKETVINPAITEQAHFLLQAKDKDGTWKQVIGTNTPYFCGVILEANTMNTMLGFDSALSAILGTNVTIEDIYRLIGSGNVRVADANGIPLTTQTRPNPEVAAAVDAANFDGSNVFYVWVSPKNAEIAEGGRTSTTISWDWFLPIAEGGLGHTTFPFTLYASITPGSNELRNDEDLWWDNVSPMPDGAIYHPPDDLYEYYIITNASQLTQRPYMSLWPQTLTLQGGANAGISIQGVQRFGDTYSAFAQALFTKDSGIGPFTFNINIRQTGNYGFAPLIPDETFQQHNGTNIGRVQAKISNKPLSVTFTLTQEAPPKTNPAPAPAPIEPTLAPLEQPTTAPISPSQNMLTLTEQTQFTPEAFIQQFGYKPPAEEILLPVASTKILKLRSLATANIGAKLNLIPLLSPGNYDLSGLIWSSSKPDIATVDKYGVVTGIKMGKTIVSVGIPGSKLKANCTITVSATPKIPLISILLNNSSLTLESGKHANLQAILNPSNASLKGISWLSNNNAVATVDAVGKVTAIAAGSATITAISDNNGYTAACVFTVLAKPVKVASVKMSQTSLIMQVGEEFLLSCNIFPENADNKNITWSSSNNNIVTVVNGRLSALKKGGAAITAVSEDGQKKTTCRVTVK